MSLLARLIEAGTPADLIEEVAMLVARAAVDREAIEARRSKDRDRQAARRHVTSRDTADVADALTLEVSPQTPLPNPDLDIPPYSPPNPEKLNGHTAEPAKPALLPEHVVDFWNENAASFGLPTASLTPKRRKVLQSRIRQHGVDDWTEAIGAIQRSPFLRGENDRGWRANIDFLLRADSITKLKEGVYDGSAH